MTDTLKLDPAPDAPFSVKAVARRDGRDHVGEAHSISKLAGFFTFPTLVVNPELVPEVFVKLLDGRTVNGMFWFFYNGLTDVPYTLEVTDPSGRVTTYPVEHPDCPLITFNADVVPPTPEPVPPANLAHQMVLIPIEFDDWTIPPQYDLAIAGQRAVNGWNDNARRCGKPEDFSYVVTPIYHVAGGHKCGIDTSYQRKAQTWALEQGYKGKIVFEFGPGEPDCGRRSNKGYIHLTGPGYGDAPTNYSLAGMLIHEAGHWLGLPHVSSIGNCGAGTTADPCDLARAFNEPWTSQGEYGGTDFMGAGNSYPAGYLWIGSRLLLRWSSSPQPTISRGGFTYIWEWHPATSRYDFGVIGPSKKDTPSGYQGGGPRSYPLPSRAAGAVWEDRTGGAAPLYIKFGANGVVTVA